MASAKPPAQLPAQPSPPSASTKAKMISIIESQPDDSSYDELLRELAFHRLVDRGLTDLARGNTLSTSELRRRVRTWPS